MSNIYIVFIFTENEIFFDKNKGHKKVNRWKYNVLNIF